jgi:peptide deformylase
MAIRPILTLPDPRLKLVSAPVPRVDAAVRGLVDDMFETMYKAPGIGLAAIQIGVAQRIVVIDTTKKDEDKRPLVLINPEIVARSEELNLHEEGCLSIPDYYEEVERPKAISVRFRDRDGNEHVLENVDGILATCIQHEVDHLDGVLFIDHLSKLKRDRVIKKFRKIAKEKAREADG